MRKVTDLWDARLQQLTGSMSLPMPKGTEGHLCWELTHRRSKAIVHVTKYYVYMGYSFDGKNTTRSEMMKGTYNERNFTQK